jgi:hypothetical protein
MIPHVSTGNTYFFTGYPVPCRMFSNQHLRPHSTFSPPNGDRRKCL